ncbi:MAG: response regulator [Coleofasciculaceae cyanobacterium SM2_3_26]|nr:response regulator [Coleofasciculaceae cyanobacterium SM2_3_26]
MNRILVIEDEETIRSNIVDLLEAEDFEAVGAENGHVGLQLARDVLPDLILCDVMMPDLDGFGVLEALRGNPQTAAIPFIFLTARADRTDMRAGMELGADDYITKPCTSSELVRAISVRLQRRSAMERSQTRNWKKPRQGWITWCITMPSPNCPTSFPSENSSAIACGCGN